MAAAAYDDVIPTVRRQGEQFSVAADIPRRRHQQHSRWHAQRHLYALLSAVFCTGFQKGSLVSSVNFKKKGAICNATFNDK